MVFEPLLEVWSISGLRQSRGFLPPHSPPLIPLTTYSYTWSLWTLIYQTSSFFWVFLHTLASAWNRALAPIYSQSEVSWSSRSHGFFQEDSTFLSKLCPSCEVVAGFSQAFKAGFPQPQSWHWTIISCFFHWNVNHGRPETLWSNSVDACCRRGDEPIA